MKIENISMQIKNEKSCARSMSDEDLVRAVRPGLTAVGPFMFHSCYNLSANLVSTIQKWTFVTFEQRSCCNHTWSCPVVAYVKPKTKQYVKFLAQKVVAVVWEIYVVVAYERVCETVFDWETKRLFVKWSLTRSGRYERVDCTKNMVVLIKGPFLCMYCGYFGEKNTKGIRNTKGIG